MTNLSVKTLKITLNCELITVVGNRKIYQKPIDGGRNKVKRSRVILCDTCMAFNKYIIKTVDPFSRPASHVR